MPCTFCRKKKKSSKLMEREFNIECLDEHNRLRNLHGVDPLLYSEKLAKSAQTFAEKLASSDRLEHSNAEEYGETLVSRYCTRECSITGKQAALVWYSEIENYDFHCENQLSCGNFSQVVWKSTREAGFGIAKTQDGHRIYVVGHYYPPGNYTNEWVENVRPPIEGRIHVPSKEELDFDERTIIGKEILNGRNRQDSIDTDDNALLSFMDDKNMTNSLNLPAENGRSSSRSSVGESEVDDSVRRLDEICDNSTPIRLPDEDEQRLLWTRKQTGVAKKDGKKISFVRRIDRYFNYSEDEPIKDILKFYELESRKEIEFDGSYTIKFNSQEKVIYEDLEKFRDEVIQLHNLYRLHHNAKPLNYLGELCEMAQMWAEKMVKEGKPFYPNETYRGIPLGEIVAYRNTFFDYLPANDLMRVWEMDASDYDYESEVNDISKSGNFTQVIWKDSTDIGIGRARCSNLQKTFVVIFFYPPGNVTGQFKRNLEPRRRMMKNL